MSQSRCGPHEFSAGSTNLCRACTESVEDASSHVASICCCFRSPYITNTAYEGGEDKDWSSPKGGLNRDPLETFRLDTECHKVRGGDLPEKITEAQD